MMPGARTARIAGRVMSELVIAFMLFDGGAKLVPLGVVVSAGPESPG